MEEATDGLKHIKVHCDGGARGNPGPGACAFVVLNDNDEILHQQSKYLGTVTNNIAEYNGVILALNWLIENDGYNQIDFYLDSQLVVNQLIGKYKIKNETLKKLRSNISDQEGELKTKIHYYYVPRNMNKLPDKLLNKEIDENL